MKQTDSGQRDDIPGWAVDAAHRALKSNSRLEKLHLDGAISDAAFTAGARYREEVEALETTARGDNAGIRTAPGPREPPQRKLIALGRIRQVKQQLGNTIASLLIGVAAHNRSFRDIGREMNVDKNTARSWFITGLDGLAAITSEWR